MTADGPKNSARVVFSARRREVRVLENYVGGGWRSVDGAKKLDDIDPASGEVVGEVRSAVEAARAAQRTWRDVPPQRRARAVLALRDRLLSRREELVALVSA